MTTPAPPRCPHCLDEGHVCEEHPEFPWEVKVEGHDGTAPGHGAGMPCPYCCSDIPQDGTHSIAEAFVPDWKRPDLVRALAIDPTLGGKLHDVHGGPGEDCWCGYVGHEPSWDWA